MANKNITITDVVEGMPFSEYLKIKAMNGSTLKHGKRSMQAIKWHYDNPEDNDTPSKILGRYVHSKILEPETVQANYFVTEHKRSTKEFKGEQKDNLGKQPIASKDHMAAQLMFDSVMNNTSAKNLLIGGRRELTVLWRYKGHPMKCRIDLLHDTPHIVDLKTAYDPRPFAFGSNAHKLGYTWSAALYSAVVEVIASKSPAFDFVVVASTPPYESAVFTVPADIMECARGDVFYLMDQYLQCRKKNQFPGIDSDYLQLPSYAMPEIDDSDVEMVDTL